MEQGRLERVVRVAEHAATICPEVVPDVRPPRLGALVAAGRDDEARVAISAIESGDNASAAAMAAAVAARKALAARADIPAPGSNSAEAQAVFLEAIKSLDAKNYVASQEAFLRAHSLRPPHGTALYYAGRAARGAGKASEAQRLFARALVEIERERGAKVSLSLPRGARRPGFHQKVKTLDTLWSPNRQYAVRMTGFAAVAVFDERIGYRVRSVLTVDGIVSAVAISPDSRRLAVASNNGLSVVLWDLEQQRQVTTINHPSVMPASRHCPPEAPHPCRPFLPEHVDVLRFSPDSRLLVVGSDYEIGDGGTIWLYSAVDGQRRRRVQTQRGGRLEFSPDGSKLLSAAVGNQRYDMNLMRNLVKDRHGRKNTGLVVSSVASGRTLRVLGPGGGVNDFCFLGATDDVSVSFGDLFDLERRTQVWNMRTGKFVRDAAGADLSSCRPWSSSSWSYKWTDAVGEATPTSAQRALLKRGFANAFGGGGWPVTTLALAPDRVTLLTDRAKFTFGAQPASTSFPNETTHALAFYADKVVASRYHVQPRFTGMKRPPPHPEGLDRLRVMSLKDGAASFLQFNGGPDQRCAAYRAVSGDGKRVASGCRAQVVVADIESKKVVRTLSWDQDLWRPKSGYLSLTQALRDRVLWQLALSPDGRTVAASSYAGVMLWDVDSGKLLHKLRGPNDLVTDKHAEDRAISRLPLAFSPDGTRIAAALGSVTVWDVRSGAKLHSFVGHKGLVTGLSWIDDHTLVTGSVDRTAVVWDLTRRRVRTRIRTESRVTAVSPGPTANSFVFADGHIQLADVDGNRWLTVVHGGVAVDTNMHMEALAGAEDVVEGLTCSVGGWTFPIELCRDRFEVSGMIAKRWAGDLSVASP